MTFGIALAFGVVAAGAGHVLLRRFFLDRTALGAVVAVTAFVAGQVGYYVALRGLDVGSVYMANGLIPVVALALSHALLDERVSRHQIGATALIVAGVIVYNL